MLFSEGVLMPRTHILGSSVDERLSWLVCGRSRSPRSSRTSGISDSCLRNWMVQADIHDGRRQAA